MIFALVNTFTQPALGDCSHEDRDPADRNPRDCEPEEPDPEECDPEECDPEECNPEDCDPEDCNPEDCDPEDCHMVSSQQPEEALHKRTTNARLSRECWPEGHPRWHRPERC